jgi:glycosyltransferase involved in cell wall biosynthesis
MHLFLNCLAASAGGGLTYVRNIIPEIVKCSDLHCTIALRSDLPVSLEAGPNVFFLRLTVPSNAARRFYWEQQHLPEVIRKSGADVLISTGNFALRRSPVPQILLSGNSLYVSETYSRDLLQRGKYGMWLDNRARAYFARRSVHWADCTVAPSHAFAKQLRDWTRRPVQAIHHGFSPEIFFADKTLLPDLIQEKLRPGGDVLRLLFVSHYNYYRNFETLLRSVALVRKRLRQIKVQLFLTCTFRKEDNPGSFDPSSARKLVGELGLIDTVVELGTVPYHHLHKLYKACHIYMTAAYAETFAHPLVEAMACGMPIIASDLPVHREIAGEAASYFPVFSPDALANQVVDLARSPELQKARSDAGCHRASEFSWQKHLLSLVEIASALTNSVHA